MEDQTPEGRLGHLHEAIARVRRARAARNKQYLESVHRAAQAASTVFADHAREVRSHAERLLTQGAPPSLRQVCGTWDLEVPLNRVLGWLLNPTEHHGAGAAPLLTIARALDFSEMVKDLREEADAEVFVECSPNPARWTRAPDLLIKTSSAVLLIENKVFAPESGAGQYEDYLEIAKGEAEGRSLQAVLLARNKRACPKGWTRFLSHAELAGLLEPLCLDRRISAWTRITLALVIADLRNVDLVAHIASVRQLLKDKPESVSTPFFVRRLSRLIEDIPEILPWEAS